MCFVKVISINNQLKYVVYRIRSVWWLHIYPDCNKKLLLSLWIVKTNRIK
jgi:hypothetical protein